MAVSRETRETRTGQTLTHRISDHEGGDQVVFEGYAALFNSPTTIRENGKTFQETILPGAFSRTLQTKDLDTRALFNHDRNHILGRSTNGTLLLREDEMGLLMTIYPPDTQWVRDLIISVKRGDINNSSFAFSLLPDGDQWTRDSSNLKRQLTALDIDQGT